MSSVLSASAAGLSFLANNPRVARALGRSGDLTTSFAEAEEQDAVYRGTSTWNGLDSGGFYDPADVSEFRGVNTASAGLLSRKSTPSPLGDDFRGPLFTVGNLIEGPTEDGLHIRTPDDAALLDTLRTRSEDRGYLGDELLSPDLYGDGTAVRDLIRNSPELLDAYTGDYSRSARTQQFDLAHEAALRIPGTEDTDFAFEGDLARLIVEERGDLKSILEDNPRLVDLIGENPDEVLRDRSRERVVDAVEPLLKNTSDILTRDWLEDNPLVALELLRNPGYRAWVEEDRDNARSLLADADRISTRVIEGLAEEAANRVNADSYDEEWFSSQSTLAEVIVADEVLDVENQLGDWMHTQQETLPYKTSGRALAEGYLADTALKETNSTLPEHLFTESPALSMLTTGSSEIAQGLIADAENINASYPGLPSLADQTIAYRVWGLGYGEQLHGSYEGIA